MIAFCLVFASSSSRSKPILRPRQNKALCTRYSNFKSSSCVMERKISTNHRASLSSSFSPSSPSSLSSSSSTGRTFDVYPFSHLSELTSRHLHVKVVHVVRHAEGTHNVNKEYRDIRNLDARLTEKGIRQCRMLAQRILDLQNEDEKALTHLREQTQMVVTSPLTRCIETSLESFPFLVDNPNIPFIAHESIRETVNYICDRRRPLSDMRKDFGNRVDFSDMEHDDDELWHSYARRVAPDHNAHRESAELFAVAQRGRRFFEWLEKRPEANVILSSHSAFLRCIFNWGHPGGVPFTPAQILDTRATDPELRGGESSSLPIEDYPVFKYCGDEDFEEYMRKDFKNCELRTFLVTFY